MSGPVRVEDFEVFRLFRAALLKFAQTAERSLSHADNEIVHMRSWLETEQASFWHGQLRKRTEAVTAARDALRQKKIYRDSTGKTPAAIEEEKALARCVAAAEEAQRKIEAVRKSLPRLEKESGMYHGGVAPLQGDLGGEIPRAVTLLDRLAASLEQYAAIEAPAAFSPEGTLGEGAMSRGEDAAEMMANPPAAAAPEGSEEAAVDGKEGPDVAGGK